jgi:hypothetical protein
MKRFEIDFSKNFGSELQEHLIKNYKPLNEYELNKLTTWLHEESYINIYENIKEQRDDIYEYLINSDYLEYVNVETLARNLTIDLENNQNTRDILALIIQAPYRATNLLQIIVDIESLIDEIMLDGIGNIVNFYDGEVIELTPLDDETTYHTLTLS